MNISIDGFTDEELLTGLLSTSRIVEYRYIIEDVNDVAIGTAEVSDGVISYDSKSDIMRTFSGTLKSSDLINIDSVDYRIVPIMRLKMGDLWAEWPLGKFIINPSMSGNRYETSIRITGYDNGKILMDDKADRFIHIGAGAVYTSFVSQILADVYGIYEVPAAAITKSYDQEWDAGTSKLEIVNTLLDSIGYTKLYFDEYGTPTAEEYVDPYQRMIDMSFIANEKSVISDSVQVSTNKFEVPNKFVRYTENVDSDYLISVYVNDDASSPYSTVSRGRLIVDSRSVHDIASQADLDAYTIKAAAEAMQAVETLTFSTINMPGHGYRDCMLVKIDQYGIEGKYVETGWEMSLTSNGTMKHKCERVIT